MTSEPTSEPNSKGPTGTSSSRARGSEVRGGSEDDERLDDVGSNDGVVRSAGDREGTRAVRDREPLGGGDPRRDRMPP